MPPKSKKAQAPTDRETRASSKEANPPQRVTRASERSPLQQDLPAKKKARLVPDSPSKGKAKPETKEEKSKKGSKKVQKSPSPVKQTKTGKGKKKEAKEQPMTSQKQPEGEQKGEGEMKKVLLKGLAPVDQYFSKGAANYKIHTDNLGYYSATLNQSNISGNNNKFYIIQVLVSQSNPNQVYLFTRWGRVGVVGQNSEQSFSNLPTAVKEYHKKMHEKTRKGYRVVEMNYEAEEEEEKPERSLRKDQPPSELPSQVQELVKLMFDMNMMNSQMKEIGYDAKKMPLGKLAKSSIKKGYEILKDIMDKIKARGDNKDVIEALSSDFYSEIPHNFGFQHMSNFILDTEAKVKAKLEMLQTIEDIQVFTKLINEGSDQTNELDSNYAKLDTKLKPLPKGQVYDLLLKYVENTHGKTHTAYHLEVLEIFEVDKQADSDRYRKDIGNKMLLWHGSRLTNFVGILSQGLRIAPPEAPVTGYMFGKGVYFADMVTKSANYCFTSPQNTTGLMLLCEVAMGEMNEKFYADYYASNLPEGKHSTKGCGKTAPKDGQMLGEVLVPCGEGVETGAQATSLLYNQFIVYDVAQIKTRYLFKMKFNYN